MAENEKLALGQRIKQVRKSRGENQEDFGAIIGGFKKSAISAYESGDNSPSPETLAAIARSGKVTLDWLITGQEESYPAPRATDPRLEAAVRERADEWRRPGEPQSDFEQRVVGMLRRVSPKARQHILDMLTTAYFNEMEEREEERQREG